MKFKSKINFTVTKLSLFYSILFGMFTLAARFPFKGAEDVINARNNLIAGHRLDFWGSFSPWFYSIQKSQHWEIFYAATFVLMISSASYFFLRHNSSIFRKPLILTAYLVCFYFSLLFSTNFSRDGAMLSFFWFSLGLWILATSKVGVIRYIIVFVSLLMLCIGFSFRPWLALSSIFIVLALNSHFPCLNLKFSNLSSYLILLLILVSPLALDSSFHRTQKLINSYPEQQVMIMDVASMACLSASKIQSEKALEILNTISSQKPLTKSILCAQFYPQNWGSVVFYGNDKNQANAIRQITANDSQDYKQFRRDWKTLISSNLSLYIQIKILLGSQFLLAGDSINLKANSLQTIFQFPFNIAKFLRLFSILPILLLINFQFLRINKFQKSNQGLLIFESLFYSSFLIVTTIAFIGDNQRYIFFPSIVVFLLAILNELKGWHEKI